MRWHLPGRVAAAVTTGLVVLGSLVTLSVAGPARADLQHPRQQFLRNSQGGLFLHWGMRTAPAHTSCSAWESAVTSGGWNANYWVDEARKLHLQYLVFASFHSRLGYARAWPSSIPGSCRTNRDFLRELINAANAQGLKVILYMTDDPKWFNEGLGAGQSWMDSAAYSRHKGRTVDLHTRPGFGEFSYDNFFEVMQRYPELGGFWIDNENEYWKSNQLYQKIYQTRPNFTLSNNNTDTAVMDMISNEQKVGMTPSYDYPQAIYTAAPRLIEACYKLPSSGSWWYSGSDSAVDRRLNVGRLITNAGSSVKSNMAETAMKSGRFPPQQEAYNNFLNGYLNQIWGSLEGTEGGGYMYGGLKPGFWNDGAHGVTTISKTNPNLHFIHALTRPSGSTLRVRDNGYQVTRVTNFRTNATVSFTQNGGNLTLTGIPAWDEHDTVFRVETNGRQGIYPPSTYTMSASASAGGRPASAAADGNYLTYWDSNKALPVSLRFDLGAARRVQYVGVNQREDSVSYARSGGEQSARIRDYRVYLSSDGSNWGSPVRSGALPSHRGVHMIDLPATTTRHVRLEVLSTWAAASDSARVNRLRVDEAWIGSAYAGSPRPGRSEAEDATISQGAVETEHAGFSGSGYVNTVNAVGPFVQWTANATTAGSRTLTIGYANGATTNRPLSLSVNGGPATTVDFPATGAWTSYATATATVTLAAGTNTIRLTSTVADGGPNLDYLDSSTG